jgi:multisubunit Na+/H+ antiporter MnhB subunit
MSWWVSLADTVVAMPLVMLVGAVAVIVLLMLVGMRQRWEPEIPPTFGTGPQPPPPPRVYGVLAIVGISLVVIGGLLGALLHSPGLVFVGGAVYTATWIVRHILLFWEEAENRWMRAAAVARPVSVVAGIALSAATRSIWWLVVGAALYVGIWPVVRYIARRRGERRDLGGLSGNP